MAAATSRILTAVELMAMDFPEPRWAVPGIVPEGLSVMAGKPKLGKSWLAYGAALAIARGAEALGSVKVEQGEVLYIAFEDSGRRLQSRLSILLGGTKPPAGLHLAREWPRGDEGVELIAEWLAEHEQARLVIIDTLARFRSRRKGNGSRGYDDDTEDLVPLHKLANDEQVGILLLHHNRKLQAEDWIDELSGTLGIAGTADALLGLFRTRGKDQAELKLTGRDVEERELALSFEPLMGRWTYIGEADEVGQSDEDQDILDLLAQQGPMSPNQVAVHLGMERSYTNRRLLRMARDGQVASASGKYKPIALIAPVALSAMSAASATGLGNNSTPFHPWSPDKIGGSERGQR